jgi:hypothetical protein
MYGTEKNQQVELEIFYEEQSGKRTKQITYKQWFDRADLGYPSEYTKNGKTVPGKAVVYDRFSGQFYNINHPVEQLLEIKRQVGVTTEEIGFHKHLKKAV